MNSMLLYSFFLEFIFIRIIGSALDSKKYKNTYCIMSILLFFPLYSKITIFTYCSLIPTNNDLYLHASYSVNSSYIHYTEKYPTFG